MADLSLPDNEAADTSLNRISWISILSVAALVFGLGAWAFFTSIAGAVIAGGFLVVESNAKRVQHAEGGIVAAIMARNEDHVNAGDVLLRLDDTMLRASLNVVNNQLDEARAIEARLVAEVGDDSDFTVPPELEVRRAEPGVESLITAQRQLASARQAVREGNVSQLSEQIAQFESQLQGLSVQRVASQQQHDVVAKELADLAGLLDSQLVQKSQVNGLTREKARLEGELGSVDASMSQIRASIAERRVMIGQVDSNFLSDALSQLQELREKIAQLLQQKIAAEDRLARVAIVAPQSGVVHQSIVNTVGGVVGPGETLMMVVPTDDRLVVEIRLNPLHVDKVKVGQEVVLKLPGLDPRITPDLPGHITQVAPDLTNDAQTGQQYYLARVTFDDDAMTALPPNLELIPGMPAEAFIQTGERTVFTYLLEPLTEQFQRAMRES